MSKKITILSKIKSLFQNTVDITTKDGKLLRSTALEEGAYIVEIIDGVESELADVTYETETHNITVVGSIITSLVEVTVEEVEEEEEVIEEEMQVSEEAVKFIDATLKDGTMIHVTTQIEGNLTLGDLVEVVDIEGNKSLAPEGSHELEDDTVIILDGESKITEINLPEGQEEVVVEDEEFSKVVLNALEIFKAQNVELTNQVKELTEKVNKLAKSDSAESTETKHDFSKEKSNKENKLNFFAKR